MSKKVTLPGKKAYGKATEYMRKKQIYTKTDLITYLTSECGKSEVAAVATAVVLLSPRETSKGDCRGNMSNPWGHLAYNDKLNRKKGADGKNEPQKFRFRMRKTAMEPLKRGSGGKVEAEKTSTATKVDAKTPVKA